MAELFNWGSFVHGSPQVMFAHCIPVNKPRKQKTIPVFTASTAKVSFFKLEELKYFTLYITDTRYMLSMLNHMGTWKYTFRIDSFKICNLGTGPRKPATIEKPTKTTPRYFHHIFLIMSILYFKEFNLSKGKEITIKK